MVTNSVVSSINDIKQIDKISTTASSNNNNNNKMSNIQPYPVNLKVEKIDNNNSSIIISWDTPPILPAISDNNFKTLNMISMAFIISGPLLFRSKRQT